MSYTPEAKGEMINIVARKLQGEYIGLREKPAGRYGPNVFFHVIIW